MDNTGKVQKARCLAKVTAQESLADGIYSMWIQAGEIAAEARPGQFLSLYTRDASRLLPRPISICEIDREKGSLRIVYRIAGAGTEEFSHYRAGDMVTVMGPLGNGFPLDSDWRRNRDTADAAAGKGAEMPEADGSGIPGSAVFKRRV